MHDTTLENNSRPEQATKPGKVHLLFMQTRYKLWQALLTTILVMFALIFIVYFFKVPNPNMILIAGLVICSTIFGFSGGIPAAIIMLMYTLYFFSDNNSFVQFSPENMQKVIVTLIGVLVDMIFVCILKKQENEAFHEIRELSEKLEHENQLLKMASTTDTLTGIGNRLALRRDFNSYQSKDIYVIMVDIDNFKSINDKYGHFQGDSVLSATGSLLSGLFGMNHCYRYGGDEFLIVTDELKAEELQPKLDYIMSHKPVIEEDPEKSAIGYSIGYCRGNAEGSFELRALLDRADELMYEAKTSGKNRVIGEQTD